MYILSHLCLQQRVDECVRIACDYVNYEKSKQVYIVMSKEAFETYLFNKFQEKYKNIIKVRFLLDNKINKIYISNKKEEVFK